MDRKKQWERKKADGSAKLSIVLLVLNVVMLMVAASRLFCPEGDILPKREGGVDLESICAAAEAALGILSSGDVPMLEGVTSLKGREKENAHLGIPPVDAPVVVITSPEGLRWEDTLRIPEGMTVRKVFIVEAAPESNAGQM